MLIAAPQHAFVTHQDASSAQVMVPVMVQVYPMPQVQGANQQGPMQAMMGPMVDQSGMMYAPVAMAQSMAPAQTWHQPEEAQTWHQEAALQPVVDQSAAVPHNEQDVFGLPRGAKVFVHDGGALQPAPRVYVHESDGVLQPAPISRMPPSAPAAQIDIHPCAGQPAPAAAQVAQPPLAARNAKIFVHDSDGALRQVAQCGEEDGKESVEVLEVNRKGGNHSRMGQQGQPKAQQLRSALKSSRNIVKAPSSADSTSLDSWPSPCLSDVASSCDVASSDVASSCDVPPPPGRRAALGGRRSIAWADETDDAEPEAPPAVSRRSLPPPPSEKPPPAPAGQAPRAEAPPEAKSRSHRGQRSNPRAKAPVVEVRARQGAMSSLASFSTRTAFVLPPSAAQAPPFDVSAMSVSHVVLCQVYVAVSQASATSKTTEAAPKRTTKAQNRQERRRQPLPAPVAGRPAGRRPASSQPHVASAVAAGSSASSMFSTMRSWVGSLVERSQVKLSCAFAKLHSGSSPAPPTLVAGVVVVVFALGVAGFVCMGGVTGLGGLPRRPAGSSVNAWAAVPARPSSVLPGERKIGALVQRLDVDAARAVAAVKHQVEYSTWSTAADAAAEDLEGMLKGLALGDADDWGPGGADDWKQMLKTYKGILNKYPSSELEDMLSDSDPLSRLYFLMHLQSMAEARYKGVDTTGYPGYESPFASANPGYGPGIPGSGYGSGSTGSGYGPGFPGYGW